VDGEWLVTDGKGHNRQALPLRSGRENVSTHTLVVSSSGDCSIDEFARNIIYKCQSGTSVSDGSVSDERDAGSIDLGPLGAELLEAARGVDEGIVDCPTSDELRIYFAKCVDGLYVIARVRQISREKLRTVIQTRLQGQILHWRMHSVRLNCVDRSLRTSARISEDLETLGTYKS
jgi:hypothetical protein